MSQIIPAKIKVLEERQEILLKQYSEVISALNTTLNPAEGPQLQEKSERIWQVVEEVEKQLEDLKSQLAQATSNDLQKIKNWVNCLPHIDYKDARTLARDVFDHLEAKEGGVLFLLQRSTEMGGDLCMTAIKKLLEEKMDDTKIIARPIGFTALERPNEIEFIHKLAGQLNAPLVDDNLEASLDSVLDKLCASVQSGGALIIEVTFTDSKALHPRLLHWLVEKFWCALMARLLMLAPDKLCFTVVLTLVVDGAIEDECHKPHVGCFDTGFDFKKILELPLKNWTIEDIRTWLMRYSGLKLTGTEYVTLAETVYRNGGGGIPASVHRSLLKTLPQMSQAQEANQ
jgi:hypothetical protein